MEARLGKSAKKLNGWVAQHRRGQRALGKTVKGAKTLWYRRDAQGYLWLPLTYQLAAAEQVPGAPYPPNATLVVHYPLPLAGSGGTAAAAGGEAEEDVVWNLDRASMDSRGRPVLSGDGEILSVLSTM